MNQKIETNTMPVCTKCGKVVDHVREVVEAGIPKQYCEACIKALRVKWESFGK